jgi:hypothetical protein
MLSQNVGRWWLPYLPLAKEKLAAKRRSRESSPGTLSAIIVFPKRLSYRDILQPIDAVPENPPRYLQYHSHGGSLLASIREFGRYLFGLLRMTGACSYMEIYHVSDRGDQPFVLAAAVVCVLRGIPFQWHDLSFGYFRGQRWRRALRALLLDSPAMPGDSAGGSGTERRPDEKIGNLSGTDKEAYQSMRKSRAVPRLLVYGDLENETVLFLVRRTYELVKQKYPRTEFTVMSLTSLHDFRHESAGPVDITEVSSEPALKVLFEASDTVLLLSPGGMNELLLRRAIESGYPVIVNGFGAKEGPFSTIIVSAIRDSYSSLAGAIVQLADDEMNYRRFAANA